MNSRTVVAIVAGGAVIIDEWDDTPAAILFSWYSGAEGGRGLADVLLGRADATGRLPFSIPVSENQLPFFDRDATEIRYDKWVGQRLLDRLGVRAAYPLGFGLSYTSFERSELLVSVVGDETLAVSCTVTDTARGPATMWSRSTECSIRPWPIFRREYCWDSRASKSARANRSGQRDRLDPTAPSSHRRWVATRCTAGAGSGRVIRGRP